MKVKELLNKVDPVQIIARAVYSDHERDKIKWILHYYGLYYGILNQPDCPSEYVVLYRAIDEKHPFADTFVRDLNEYRGGKEIFSYTCSFMEAALFCNAQVPETLIKHYVIGSTATYGSTDSSKILSEKRAAAVVQALVDNGVSEEKLVAIGIGQTKCSLRVNDIDTNGNLVEEQAIHNRAVFLLPKSNPLFTKLTKEGVL